MKKGFSLIEITIVVALFSVLMIVATQSLFLTVRSVKKTDNVTKVRESVDFALTAMERQLRNANKLITVCPASTINSISYEDSQGINASFTCLTVGSDQYIASSSASMPIAQRLTSNDIFVTNCSFSCQPGTANSPPSVTINIGARDAATPNAETGALTTSTQIYLRTY